MTTSLLERVQAAMNALPPAERRVARLVLDDARTFATRPVTELAQRAGVSKPTVVRFCRSVGYDGLTDFKRKLAGSVNEGVPFVHRAVDEGDEPGELVIKVLDNTVAALLAFRNRASAGAYARAIDLLAHAGAAGKRIQFWGVGNSGIVAEDAEHKFFRLGVHASAVHDSHTQVMGATLLGPGDVAVVFSNSGRSRDLLDAADIARRKGAATILVTASGTPLAATANGQQHVLLAADHPEDFDRYSPMVSRIMALVIVDILVTGVALKMPPDELRPRLQEIKKNLRSKRYAQGDDGLAVGKSGRSEA